MKILSKQNRTITHEYFIAACLLLLSIIIVIACCAKQRKAMESENLWNSVGRLTTMNFSDRAEVEKVLGVKLKPANGNESFSSFEYKGELPAFPNSTYADVRINNDKSGWFMMVDFKLHTCITSKTIMEKYSNGVYEPPDPNNLSDDAQSTYEVKVNSGKLVFGFDFKTDCFTGMSFNKTR